MNVPNTSQPSWSLHPQLERDTVAVGDLPLPRVLLSSNANFPWLIIVPRRAGMVEIIDLVESDQLQLMREIAQVSGVLRSLTRCDKLNVAALGNAVPQLHVHIIARFRNDTAGARPVWGQVPQAEPKSYTPDDLDRLMRQLRSGMALPANG